MSQQPTTVTLTVTPAGAELVIAALRRLPHEQVHDLVMELFTQVKQQMQPEPALVVEPEEGA